MPVCSSGDHRRGAIMTRISRFYYFNVGPERRGPRDSHTHSPILAWESFHSTQFACPVFFPAFATSMILRPKIDRSEGTLSGHLKFRLRIAGHSMAATLYKCDFRRYSMTGFANVPVRRKFEMRASVKQYIWRKNSTDRID